MSSFYGNASIGSGDGLPIVNSNDNGKVLVVDNGEWSVDTISNDSFEGLQNLVDGSAEGSVRGINTKIENENYTIGLAAFSEGNMTSASGAAAHAEGGRTKASGDSSHAEGYETVASGIHAHAEGQSTEATGDRAHTEGVGTRASGINSHASGHNTIANHSEQFVFGEFNIADTSSAAATERGTYVEIVGNGDAENHRSNARTLDWNGNEVLAGKLTVGTDPVNNMDVTTKQYVDNSIANIQNVAEITITTAGAVSQALDAGKIYHFTGAVSSLSLTLNTAANGQLAQYHFDFISGSTAATVIINGVTWIGGSFVPEASKRYEVDILNGYGVYLSW